MKSYNQNIYEKALKLYNSGKIDKAIELCEKGISNSLKDSRILNLKGLLLYIKGNLDEAIALWRISKDYNNDSIAKSYLEDSKNDFNRYVLCKEADSLIENLYIDEALENLLECGKSDFNLIEVNNLMALAYMKKGQYDNSRICLAKVINVDKNNKVAKELLKEINELLDVKDKNKLLIGSLSSIILGVLTILIIYKSGIINIDLSHNSIKEIISFKDKEKNNKEDEANNKNEEDNNFTENNKSEEDISLREDKENEDIGILNIDESPSTEEFKQLTNQEIQNNYNDGSYYFKQKNYEEVIKIFEATKISSQNSDLNDDILFFLAVAYDESKKEEKAIEAYKDFLSQYEKGNYVEEAFYKLILLYRDKDIKSSKEYAKKFTEMYPSSIYNNNKVKDILNQ